MFAYQIKLAVRSVRRNPFLAILLVGGIGLGIGVSMIFVNAYYRFSGNPIPHKSDRLFYVQMDSWDPESPFSRNRPEEPPRALTFMDAMAVMASDIPTYKSAMYTVDLTLHPEGDNVRPERARIRLCYSDFFPMFDVPFLYGGGWDPEADEKRDPVIVIDLETNQRFFGGADSVGRKLTIEDREFTVIGVLDRWNPMPRFYDTVNSELGRPEKIYMPFHFGEEFEVTNSGNDWGWKNRDPGYQGWLQSESVWVVTWVQLDSPAQRQEFAGYLDSYAMEQKKLGRFGRPLNNKVRDVMTWLESEEVIPEEATAMLLIAMLFLLVCSVNLIGILLGKFLTRAPEVGVRRALGASRKAVFFQHLIECELIGVLGGILGLGLSVVGMQWVDSLFSENFNFPLDWNLFFMAVGLSLLSALIAGIYPAWRICSIQPGLHLKMQ